MMSYEVILAQYLEALGRYLAGPSELGLSHAYDIGRNAIADGLSVIDMISLYDQAFQQITASKDGRNLHTVQTSSTNFLAECISPFEILLRGYREKNQQLQQRTSELEAANQALKLVNDELDSFSYSVSHDLRAPLRAINGFSHALQEDYAEKLDAEGRRLIQIVIDGAQRMSQLIDNVLAYARTSRREMAVSVIDMVDLVNNSLNELAQAMIGRSVEIRVAPLPPVRGDREMMRRVWMNLLDNAIKYTARKQSALIEVGAYSEGITNVYFVKDNGAGFDMKFSGKLFGVFQRLHRPEDFPGTGAGLAIVKRIITRHGGRVWAEGVISEGAKVSFALPTIETPVHEGWVSCCGR